MRYTQLSNIAESMQPARILEVGTWRGTRAVELLTASPRSFYVGFDLFEDATRDTDSAEFNVKPHFSVRQVSDYLDQYHMKGRYQLIKGNTRDTLAVFSCEPAGLAHIDGGHSIETIRSDWHNVKRLMRPDGVVVFDDYYTEVDDDFLDRYGCNRIVEELPHAVLPRTDHVMGGGKVQMVRVNMWDIANSAKTRS